MSNKNVIDSIIDSGLLVEGSTIIVGFSGGPDSLCLLHSLAQIADSYELNIVPVHVNHMLRAAAADEAMHCVEICEKLDLECMIFEADCNETAEELKISTEEAGRIIRYEIFDDVANQLCEDGETEDKILIALAHNADDQSETVLFRLLRGTGVHGLGGMPATRLSEEGFTIIRPLLEVPRASIEAYIRSNKLRPNMDETNDGTEYTRNKIRNELIPYLEEKYNPNIKAALRRFASVAAEDDSFLTDIAYAECAEGLSADNEKDALILDISEIKDAPPAINCRVISIILRALRLESETGYELVSSILGLIYSDNPSASLDLPRGYKAIRKYLTISFTDNDEYIAELMDSVRPEEGLELVKQVIMAKEFFPDNYESYAAFDFDEFNKLYPGKLGSIVLRTRQEGDFIAIKGGKSKKIQDFFTDSKISRNERDAILMACIDNEVLWIVPDNRLATEEQRKKGKYSQNFQISDKTERVLFLEVSAIL